jgi:hypothetical protein
MTCYAVTPIPAGHSARTHSSNPWSDSSAATPWLDPHYRASSLLMRGFDFQRSPPMSSLSHLFIGARFQRTERWISLVTALDKAANASGERRRLAPVTAPEPTTVSGTMLPPLLRKLLADYAATGLPPALSDEAIRALLDMLDAVASALENHYNAQLRRYHGDLFPDFDDDLPAF